jgi:hypothetical protein
MVPFTILFFVFVRGTFGGWVASPGRGDEGCAVAKFAIGARALKYQVVERHINQLASANWDGGSDLVWPPGGGEGTGDRFIG